MSQNELSTLRAIIGDIIAHRRDEVVDAIVADGWPRPMVEAGLERHAVTWNPVELVRAYVAELADQGLPDPPPGIPSEVLHIWPKLPGAGVTPVFYGLVLGVPRQRIRPSSRGHNFAEVFVDIATDHVPERIVLDREGGLDAPVVVVSGGDDTLAAIGLEMANTGGRSRLVGYGHRVSFAVVQGGTDAAEMVARDVVMWHQYGCFSVRAVTVVGTDAEADRFARDLADSVAVMEREWGATDLDTESLAQRAQALGVAQFEGPIFEAEVGWVARREGRPDGRWVAPHVVLVHRADTVEDVGFDLSPDHLQGLALAGGPHFMQAMSKRAEKLGATRVCRVGELQAPPASWPHDGRPNVAGWLGKTNDR